MKPEGVAFIVIGVFLIVILLIGITPLGPSHNMDMDEMMYSFISLKSNMHGEMISQGDFRCCLEKPCTYCLAKDEGECDCLDDIVSGKHPCGECIGEILEGHGNPYLKEYFAEAIAEKTGEKEAIQRIIDVKYA